MKHRHHILLPGSVSVESRCFLVPTSSAIREDAVLVYKGRLKNVCLGFSLETGSGLLHYLAFCHCFYRPTDPFFAEALTLYPPHPRTKTQNWANATNCQRCGSLDATCGEQ